MSRFMRVPGLALAGLMVLGLGTLSVPAAEQPARDENNSASGYVNALKSKDPLVRRQAALALGDLGARDRTAVTALRQALLDPDARVQSAAAAALQRLEDGHATETNADDPDRASKRTERAERTEHHAEAHADTARLQARIEQLTAQLKEEQARSQKLTQELQVAQKHADEAARAADKAKADAAAAEKAHAQSRSADNELESKLKTAQALALSKAKDAADLRDQVTSLKMQIKSLTERNEQLARQLAGTHAVAPAPLPAPIPVPAPAAAPPAARPPDQVSGTVRQVDPSGLVSFSLGTDNGVARGQQWQIFRDNSDTHAPPRLLGTMAIVSTDKHESVGRIERVSDPVRAGDRVVGVPAK